MSCVAAYPSYSHRHKHTSTETEREDGRWRHRCLYCSHRGWTWGRPLPLYPPSVTSLIFLETLNEVLVYSGTTVLESDSNGVITKFSVISPTIPPACYTSRPSYLLPVIPPVCHTPHPPYLPPVIPPACHTSRPSHLPVIPPARHTSCPSYLLDYDRFYDREEWLAYLIEALIAPCQFINQWHLFTNKTHWWQTDAVILLSQKDRVKKEVVELLAQCGIT